jgi:hypothetical protein
MNGLRGPRNRLKFHFERHRTSMYAHWLAVVSRGLLLSLVAAIAVAAIGNPGFKAGQFDPPRLAPDFALQGSDGHELKMSQYRGKVVLLSFGYPPAPRSVRSPWRRWLRYGAS